MRHCCLALVGLLIGQGMLIAQQPGQTTLDPFRSKIDFVLVNWEKTMGSINSLVTQVQRTDVDKVFGRKDIFEGQAKYLKTKQGSLASLHLVKKGQPQKFEKFLITGTFLYQWVPQTKVIRVHDMPKPKTGNVSDENLVSFLFGMKAAQAKQRYHLTWINPPPNDKWYYYVEIRPKTKADKADFARARLVLLRSTFLPRQLWFEDLNGSEITWDFQRVQTNVNLRVTDFAHPQLPNGWRFERSSQQSRNPTPPPRVKRFQK